MQIEIKNTRGIRNRWMWNSATMNKELAKIDETLMTSLIQDTMWLMMYGALADKLSFEFEEYQRQTHRGMPWYKTANVTEM